MMTIVISSLQHPRACCRNAAVERTHRFTHALTQTHQRGTGVSRCDPPVFSSPRPCHPPRNIPLSCLVLPCLAWPGLALPCHGLALSCLALFLLPRPPRAPAVQLFCGSPPHRLVSPSQPLASIRPPSFHLPASTHARVGGSRSSSARLAWPHATCRVECAVRHFGICIHRISESVPILFLFTHTPPPLRALRRPGPPYSMSPSFSLLISGLAG